MAMPCTAPAGAVTFNASGNLSGSASASAGVLQVNAKIIEANRMRRMVKSLSFWRGRHAICVVSRFVSLTFESSGVAFTKIATTYVKITMWIMPMGWIYR
jgi:hypothetical protein